MKNILIALLAVWAVAATFMALRKSEPPPSPAGEPPAAPSPAAEAAASARREGARREGVSREEGRALQSEVAKLRAENTRLGKELVEARLRPAAPAASGFASARTNAIPVKTLSEATNLAAALATQIQKELSRQLGSMGGGLFGSSPEALEQKYAPLLKQLALDSGRRAAFLKAMAEDPATVFLGSLAGKAPESQALKELLTPGDYAAWQTFEAASPYREAVRDLDQRLVRQGASLSDAQRANLQDIFQRHGLSRANHIEFTSSERGKADSSTLDKNYDHWDAIVQESRAVLNAGQQKELDLYLGERAEAHERLVKDVTIKSLPVPAQGGAQGAVGSVTVISTEFSTSATTGGTGAVRIGLGETTPP